MAGSDFVQLECDHCGGDTFVIYLHVQRIVAKCDGCGCELEQRIGS